MVMKESDSSKVAELRMCSPIFTTLFAGQRLFDLLSLLCPAEAQGEAGEVAFAGGAVVQSSRTFSHAFRLDRHPPSQHRQQHGRSGPVGPRL